MLTKDNICIFFKHKGCSVTKGECVVINNKPFNCDLVSNEILGEYIELEQRLLNLRDNIILEINKRWSSLYG